MTKISSTDLSRTEAELTGEIRVESNKLSHLLVAVSLGRQKQTHLVKVSRRRLARLWTILAQKRFFPGQPSSKSFSRLEKVQKTQSGQPRP